MPFSQACTELVTTASQRLPCREQAVKAQDVAFEVWPHQQPGVALCGRPAGHPGACFLRGDLPVTPSSDVPGIWGTGDTYDFWVATVAWQLDSKTLQYLATCGGPPFRVALLLERNFWAAFALAITASEEEEEE